MSAFLSAKEMNTELSKKLNDIFERSRKRRYAAFKKAKRLERRSGQAAPQNMPHASNVEIPKGILSKDPSHQYAQRGSDYIRNLDGRDVYRNFSHPHLEGIRDEVRERAEFPGGPKANFTPSAESPTGALAGRQYPYPWQAHHLLPGSAFYYETASGLCFTYYQIRLLLQTDYNINHGHNIIMLPEESWSVPIHCLLQHPSDHPQYTQKVMADFKRTSKHLQEKVDQGQPHENIALHLFERLKQLENRYWKFLVALSRRVVANVEADRAFVHNHVRYEAKSGTAYEYGALY